jgi:hypothetical protein
MKKSTYKSATPDLLEEDKFGRRMMLQEWHLHDPRHARPSVHLPRQVYWLIISLYIRLCRQ